MKKQRSASTCTQQVAKYKHYCTGVAQWYAKF